MITAASILFLAASVPYVAAKYISGRDSIYKPTEEQLRRDDEQIKKRMEELHKPSEKALEIQELKRRNDEKYKNYKCDWL